MIGNLFYWIFNMSIAATVSGFFILVFRKIKKLPRRFVCFLWLIPFLRLVLPFGISGKYSLMWLISKFSAKTVVIYELREIPVASSMNFIQGAKSYFPIEYKHNVLEKLFEIAGLVWAVFFFSLLIAFCFLYFSTKRELSDSGHLEKNVYFSEKVSSPAVYGVFRPKIILPLSAKNRDISLVLLHENAHIKRQDNLKRVIFFIAVFVHWFNPFVWLFLKKFTEDCELACDESVLKKLDDEGRKKYAHTILDFKERQTVFVSTFSGARVKTRIEKIISYKKISFFSSVVFSLMCCAIFYFLAVNSI